MQTVRKALIIVGPTAVGKTKLSVEMALQMDGEILSADSMQIYRGMDIGTAKATLAEQQGIKHWGLDIVSPDTPYTVADYQRYARSVIADIQSRGKLPVVVGGTGLYIKSLIDPLDFTPAGENTAYRDELYERAETHGSEDLHAELLKHDPVSAGRIHPNDVKRLVRALEVFHATGIPMSQSYLPPEHAETLLPDFTMIGLSMSDRERLYAGINDRVDQMVSEGLIEEVELLLKSGIKRDVTSMQAIGYKEISDYLAGSCSLDEAIAAVKQNSRRLAKRQLSWFRRDPRVQWIYTDQHSWPEVVQISRSMIEGISMSCIE